jgi:integrase
MASIVNDPRGLKRIQFFYGGIRRTIRLGKVPQKAAQSFRVRIDALLGTAAQGLTPDDETRKWLRALDDKLLQRVIATGLTKADPRRVRTLQQLLDVYFGNITVKATTRVTYRQTETSLINHFGPKVDAAAITDKDAARWREAMDKAGLATSTVSKRVKTARAVFRKAVEWQTCESNPFAHVWAGGEWNPARLRFISAEVAAKVLDHCPDTETKLVFALARYGGLRCPSEHLALNWEDINWEHPARFTVHASKKERDKTGGVRIVPMFDELRPLLLEQFEAAEPGEKWVIRGRRNAGQIWRKRVLKAIRRAGVLPWPKLFQNLRSTRQTELVDKFPLHLVCAWIGNSAMVAQKHYLQITDAHLEAAMTNPAAHKAAHQQAPTRTNENQTEPATAGIDAEKAVAADGGRSHLTPTGSRPYRKTFGIHGRPDQNGAKSAALDDVPDEVRMRMALAAIDAACREMDRSPSSPAPAATEVSR